MKLARFDLQGCAWESSEGLAAPTIFADAGKDLSLCTGLRVGVTCTSSSGSFNAHQIEDDQDSVFFARLRDEPFYAPREGPSLVRRCALAHGTSKAWRLEFST